MRNGHGAAACVISHASHVTRHTSHPYSIASNNFTSSCGGKDPRLLRAPHAHELAWSHALTLARDAEAETLLCRWVGGGGGGGGCVYLQMRALIPLPCFVLLFLFCLLHLLHLCCAHVVCCSAQRRGNKASFGSLCESYVHMSRSFFFLLTTARIFVCR